MSDIRIQAPVIIREVLSERTYHAELPNGKRVLAFTQPLDGTPDLQPGDAYTVLLSPCNFDEGRLVPADLSGVQIEHPVFPGIREA
jgi:hypothetical protein